MLSENNQPHVVPCVLPSSVMFTCHPSSLRRSCFSFEVQTNTGPLGSPGSAGYAFPEVIVTMGPSDFPTLFDLCSGSPCVRSSAPCRCFFLTDLCALAEHRSCEGWYPVPRGPGIDAARRGLSQVTGPPKSYAPESITPPGSGVPSSRAGRRMLPSRALSRWAPGNMGISGLHSCGSYACMPTHRRASYPTRRKANFRPAELGFGRVGFAPTG